jgi:hypothetical protein
MAGGAPLLDQAVNRLQGGFFNPNLPALGADLGRDILKEVEMPFAPFLVGGGNPGSGHRQVRHRAGDWVRSCTSSGTWDKVLLWGAVQAALLLGEPAKLALG